MKSDTKLMELDEFIAQALNQIVDGVSQAIEHAKTKGAYINIPITGSSGNTFQPNSASMPEPQLIKFSVAITTRESTDAKVGAGIFVAAFGVGSQVGTSSTGMDVSRIEFAIPVILPCQFDYEVKPEKGNWLIG